MSQRSLKQSHGRFIRKSSSLSRVNSQDDIEERMKAFNELLKLRDKNLALLQEDLDRDYRDIVCEEVMKKYESLG